MMQTLSRLGSLARAKPSFVKQLSSAVSITIDVGDAFKGHKTEVPSSSVATTSDELLHYFKEMYTMRRMEITCDTEYKARSIRGFCHLYDGQEAVAMGLGAALKLEDSIITSYRCHCIALIKGCSVESIFAEQFGNISGASKGKGGSMHIYNKSHNFFGGAGIVGAQVPVGAGLAFAAKYKTPAGEPMPIAIGMYGDGAANQGQIWEAANMCSLWKLPMAFVIENNKYGMGTAANRSSSNDVYYTMGNHIPGIQVNGMNVLAVRQAMSFVRDFLSSGNGPMYVEFDTYRYHGHSMSDPGTTYRTRDEVGNVRTARDPIEYVKKLLLDNNLATSEELKQIEKQIRADVQGALERAKSAQPPPANELIDDVYADHNGKNAPQSYVRMPDYHKSIRI